MSCDKVLYEELRPAEFVERINNCPIAYLPLGTLEWHGLHMPLGADGLQSKGIFEIMARKTGGIVLPMLFLGPDRAEEKDGVNYYGMDYYSFEEGCVQQLEGSSYYVNEDLFKKILDSIISNLKRAGFQMVIAHGHGPSMEAFRSEHDYYIEKYGMPTYTLGDLGSEGDEGLMTDHAAFNETTLVMGLRPELVDMTEILEDEIPVAIWGKDPRNTASEETGKRIIAENIEMLTEKIKAIAEKLPKTNRKLEYNNVKNMMR